MFRREAFPVDASRTSRPAALAEERQRNYNGSTQLYVVAIVIARCYMSACQELERIEKLKQLTAVFQPIADFRLGNVYGYEGLIRGPKDTPWHDPMMLFETAERCGCFYSLEQLCRKVVVQAFVAQRLPGKLFLNVSPDCLGQPDYPSGRTLESILEAGLDPRRVVIELTEHKPTFDYKLLSSAISHYRNMGFTVAIDDLGEGFSSLRLWSELRPEFVKIDRHFVHNIQQEPVKTQFLRSIQQIAENCGSRVIAEGIETLPELQVIKDLGIALGQGYVFAKPQAEPPEALPLATQEMLPSDNKPPPAKVASFACAERILQPVEAIAPETPNYLVFQRFRDDIELNGLPVVANGVPVGLVRRHPFIETMARPFNHELFDKKPCTLLMDTSPLVVDKQLSLHSLSGLLVYSNRQSLVDGFIISDGGKYLGMGTCYDLMRELTEIQINAARYANPLTLLPGNVPVNEQIEQLMRDNQEFYACYCDLDNFKPLNDVYGYRCGDDVIQIAGKVVERVCNSGLDFAGHIGGDDFVLLMRSRDWQERCLSAIDMFDQMVRPLFRDEHLHAGGFVAQDRRGQEVFHPLVRMSIGAVRIAPGQFASHHEISRAMSDAKAMAKKQTDERLFVERRRTATQSECV